MKKIYENDLKIQNIEKNLLEEDQESTGLASLLTE